MRKPRTRKTPFKVDHNKFLFDVDNYTSYILGFLWADGNIYKNSVNIELISEDIINVLPIFNHVGEWNLYNRQRTKDGIPFGKVQSKLNTSNKILTDFLLTMDYKNKEYGPYKILEHIGASNHKHFWHGFFDGDGCLYLEKKDDDTIGTITLQFWSCINQDWNPLINYLDLYEIKHKIWKYERSNPNSSIHRSSCLGIKNTTKIKQFLDIIYSSTMIGLNRKYQKYIKLCSTLESRRRKYPESNDYYY